MFVRKQKKCKAFYATQFLGIGVVQCGGYFQLSTSHNIEWSRKNLHEGLSLLAWPMDLVTGPCLGYVEVGSPAQCRWQYSLGRGYWAVQVWKAFRAQASMHDLIPSLLSSVAVTWLELSSTCHLYFPEMMSCKQELWSKIHPFYPKIFLAGYFITTIGNESRTLIFLKFCVLNKELTRKNLLLVCEEKKYS